VLYSADFGLDDHEGEERIALALQAAERVGQYSRSAAMLSPINKSGGKTGSMPSLPTPGGSSNAVKPSAQSRKARERGKQVAATAAAVKAATAKARTGVAAPLEPLPAVSDTDAGIPHVKGFGPSLIAPILENTIAGPDADIRRGTLRPRRASSARRNRPAGAGTLDDLRLSSSAAMLPMPLHPVSRQLKRPPALVSAFESPSVNLDPEMAEGRA